MGGLRALPQRWRRTGRLRTALRASPQQHQARRLRRSRHPAPRARRRPGHGRAREGLVMVAPNEREGTMYAWKFITESGALCHAPDEKWVPGEWLEIDGPLKLCERGFHASVKALDALRYHDA